MTVILTCLKSVTWIVKHNAIIKIIYLIQTDILYFIIEWF